MNERFTTSRLFGRRAVGEGKEQQQHAWIISFVGSEVLILLSGLGRSSEEARAGAHMVEKRSIQSIKDHKTMELFTPGTHCA
jgi:hypothetical protein